MAQYTTHAQQDALLSTNTVLGINNATTSTAAINLEAVKPFPVTGRFTVQISTTASANAANNKNVNITLQHSNVNTAANFVNIPELAPLTLTAGGGGGNVINAATRNVSLPPNTAQFIRLLAITENTGGNPNDSTATLKLLF